MSNHYQIELEEHPIELYKLLKIANLVSGGGEAKVLISNSHVLLNGEVETQKRKKIYSGDIIEFNNDFVELICHAQPVQKKPRIKNSQEKSNKYDTPAKAKDIQTNNGQRRKINFTE